MLSFTIIPGLIQKLVKGGVWVKIGATNREVRIQMLVILLNVIILYNTNRNLWWFLSIYSSLSTFLGSSA